MKFNFRLLPFAGGRWLGWGIALLIILPLAWQQYQRHLPFNGFNVSNASVAQSDILYGGPGRDDIPALTDPAVVPAAAASFLAENDRVIGLVINGVARAYPLRILTWHEVVNDYLGGEPVVVTYCPLCGTGIAFHGAPNGERLIFGVSGLLYRDNLLMYDRSSRSLWSQIRGIAVSGQQRDKKLEPLPLEHASWGAWRRRYPQTDVLSLDTGYRRDYDRDPYHDYAADAYGPVLADDQRLPPKAWIIGIRHRGASKAYPFPTLALIAPQGVVQDSLGGETIEITYNAINRSAAVHDSSGKVLPMMLAYWFAWRDLHPQTDVYERREVTDPER